MHRSEQFIQPRSKRVPAVDKPFAILNVLAKTNESMGVSEINRTIHPYLEAINQKSICLKGQVRDEVISYHSDLLNKFFIEIKIRLGCG